MVSPGAGPGGERGASTRGSGTRARRRNAQMPCLCAAAAAVRHSTARRVGQLTRHRQLMTARHAAAFRAEGHARCNRQDCTTCGGRAGMARDVGLRLVEWRISTRAAGPRDRHACRGTLGRVPPVHRRGVCFCFLAAFGMRSGQLTMRSSRSASATSSSPALTRPRTEIPAWCTVSGSPETSGCHQ